MDSVDEVGFWNCGMERNWKGRGYEMSAVDFVLCVGFAFVFEALEFCGDSE